MSAGAWLPAEKLPEKPLEILDLLKVRQSGAATLAGESADVYTPIEAAFYSYTSRGLYFKGPVFPARYELKEDSCLSKPPLIMTDSKMDA